MKKITAYIKNHMLTKVTLALHKIDGLMGVSVTDVRGFGRGNGEKGNDYVDYKPHTKIEIVCSDGIVNDVVEAIEKNAHTGLHGDGKIYISPIEEAVRISTGERGKTAI